MTPRERREKKLSFLLMLAFFTIGYLCINWISSQREAFYDLATEFDIVLPFMPIFVFGYILVYLSVVLTYVIVNDVEDWRITTINFFISTSIAYIIFLIFPVKMTLRPELVEGLRPEMISQAGISVYVTKLYYAIDLPYNCFPSLHVTYPTIATLVAWRHYPRWRIVSMLMGIIVIISVVLVKQHYIIDCVAGVVNGVVGFMLALWLIKFWPRNTRT